ncbi:unnamed protein product [Plutella xylostella]|uniref:(diamondback moth) hypothetical protein n=1 Tax=Plutella xylostella TaxID=51655 RepID=A0A8S4E6Q0_PLUXY|nr:unnamed protein product [Plutella xylostella]
MSSGEDVRLEAQNEIRQTLNLCSFYARQVGLFFTDDPPSNLLQKLKNKAAFVLSAAALLLLVAGELAYVLSLLAANTSVAEFVASLHIAGYGFISVGKMAIIWYKQDIFKQLVRELADLWPVRKDDGEAAEIKQRSLNALRFFHIFYTAFTVLGVALYNLTPIALHAWRSARGARSELGFVWHVAYPFDKRHPVYHKIAYAFEVCSGVSSVFFMLSSDLLFTATTSHITMLLRLLQLKIRRLAPERGAAGGEAGGRGAGGHWVATEDCLTEIVSCVKVHQRLIKYFNDLEKAFSLVNLINTVLSSVDICCVVFVIVVSIQVAAAAYLQGVRKG